jgi:uncharacterized protein YaiL (DUF2058 family)
LVSSVSLTAVAAHPAAQAPRPFVTATPLRRFDFKQQELEKRRRRQLERAGVRVDDDDDEPWVLPEEQQRIDEADAATKAADEERVRDLLAARQLADRQKQKDFRKFRAVQLKRSKEVKKANASDPMSSPVEAAKAARASEVVVDEKLELAMRAKGELDVESDYDNSGDVDVDDKRNFHKEMMRDRK